MALGVRSFKFFLTYRAFGFYTDLGFLLEAMREIARAAQAFRILADYLERHPEALLSGKKEDSR